MCRAVSWGLLVFKKGASCGKYKTIREGQWKFRVTESKDQKKR